MKILALTGGIASGKSTVSGKLRELGAFIIDADKIARDLAEPGQPLWNAYVEHFGKNVLLEDGTLDRRAIGRRVFQEKKEKEWIDRVSHPMVREILEHELAYGKETGRSVAVLDVPLLFESGWDSLADFIWVVYVPPQVQIARLMNRDACDEAAAMDRIHAQWSLEEKKRLADVVIDNSGTWKKTEKQVESAWRNLNREG